MRLEKSAFYGNLNYFSWSLNMSESAINTMTKTVCMYQGCLGLVVKIEVLYTIGHRFEFPLPFFVLCTAFMAPMDQKTKNKNSMHADENSL